MDELTNRIPFWNTVKKYRFCILILVLGLLLLAFPDSSAAHTPDPGLPQIREATLEDSLKQILCQISGVGEVDVLLTQAAGERVTYQTNESISAENTRRDTVLITDANRVEDGLVRQVIPPTYLGAIVVCQGADSAQVRLDIVEAVMSATGLSSDRITVLKMK